METSYWPLRASNSSVTKPALSTRLELLQIRGETGHDDRVVVVDERSRSRGEALGSVYVAPGATLDMVLGCRVAGATRGR